jgi:hypothetical protein
MADQVAAVEGKIDHILRETNPTHLFNVRFRQEQVDIYDPLLLAARQDVVWKLNRYTLAAASEATFNQWHRKGSNIPPLIKTITRKGTPTVSYNPLHRKRWSNTPVHRVGPVLKWGNESRTSRTESGTKTTDASGSSAVGCGVFE